MPTDPATMGLPPAADTPVSNGSAEGSGGPLDTDRRVFDASPFATMVFDLDLTLLDSNAMHAKITGMPTEALRGRSMFEAFPPNPHQDGPDTESIIRASVKRMLRTGAPDEAPVQRHDLPQPDGTFEHRYWRMIHSPIRDETDAIVAVRQDAWDVTATIEATQRAEAMRRSAQTAANVAFWEADLERGTIVPSPELERMFGYAPGESGGSIDKLLERIHPDDVEGVQRTIETFQAGPDRVPTQIEYRTRAPADADALDEEPQTRHLIVRAEMMPAGERRLLVGTAFDVTPLKQHEAELSEALDQKDTLLDEVNHRVKNSLQLVASILALGARGEENGTARQRLNEASARVQAVASVHAALYHTDDVRSVPFGEHLRAFCARIAASAGLAERGIELVVDAQEASIATEKAVALSLIVNELVTNSLKYAFPEESAPGTARVVVSLERHDDGLVLSVADNGGGTGSGNVSNDEGADDTSSRDKLGGGLGSRLVATLARQVEARIEQSHDGGWRTRIAFSE